MSCAKISVCGSVPQYLPKTTQTIASILGGARSKSARGGPYKDGRISIVVLHFNRLNLRPVRVADLFTVMVLHSGLSSGADGTPAPNLYQPSQAHTPRAATHIMAARHPELRQDETPGPGASASHMCDDKCNVL